MSNAHNNRSKGIWNGMNWIRQEKRLSIYMRDGLACVWCGSSIEQDPVCILTLDHITPHSKGGSNNETNLVTSCKRCNSSRGARSINKFASAVAEYLNHGADPKAIAAHVRSCARRAIDVAAAKEIIARRK